MRSWIITRPEPDATRLRARLEALGLESVASPLMSITAVEPEELPPPFLQALLFTSANAVRHCPPIWRLTDVQVLAVGGATASAAREAGFRNVLVSGGDADALLRTALEILGPSAGPVVHLCGRIVAADLVGALKRAGLDATAVTVYRAEPVAQLPAPLYCLLEQGSVRGVLLFSPRTAYTFARLTVAAGACRYLREVYAVCLSRAVADRIGDLPWSGVRVAARPDAEALIDCLTTLAGLDPEKGSPAAR